MIGRHAISFRRRTSPIVARIFGDWPYSIVLQPTVSNKETHAVADRRGDNIMTVYPSLLRAKKVITMLRSDSVKRATVAPSFRAWKVVSIAIEMQGFITYRLETVVH